jgi:hypothetical protein
LRTLILPSGLYQRPKIGAGDNAMGGRRCKLVIRLADAASGRRRELIMQFVDAMAAGTS